MPTDRRKENLKNMTLIELKEVLNREISLLKNVQIIKNLPDKGESIKVFREIVENEIKFREQVTNLEQSVNSLLLVEDSQKHAHKLCDFERNPEKDRYKPFSTLNKTIEIKPDRKVFKSMEDCKLDNKPTKMIPLQESLEILKQQEDRVKEEQVKIRYDRIMDKIKENTEKSDDDESSDDAIASLEEND